MGFWIRILTVFCWLLLTSKATQSQPVDLVPFSKAVETPDSLSVGEAVSLFASDQVITENTTFGFSENYFWILVQIPVQNLNEQYILDVDNPHIDKLTAYRISDGEFYHLGQSGDRIPFASRTVENRRNVFQVNFSKTTDSLLIMADKRNAAVSVPIQLWKRPDFERNEAKANMSYGLYFGMLMLITLYSLLIFALQRSQVYLWYALYVVCLFLYLFTHIGYGFQFLFPERFEWSNYLRLIMIVAMLVSQIRFTQLFLPVKQVTPKINKTYFGIIALLVVIVSWWVAVPGLFTTYTIVVINVIYGIIAVSVVLLGIVLFKSWTTDKTSVSFYSVAFGANILAMLLMIAEEYGAITLSFLPVPALFVGSFLEILIFAIGLSYRAKLIGDDRAKLLSNIRSLKQQALQAFVTGVEEEKVRVANELHDDVVSQLSLLKMTIDKHSKEDVSKKIDAISNDVRTLSHRLNPVSLNSDTLLSKIEELISEHRSQNLQIDYQVYDVSNMLTEEVGLELFRILQEALANIQKHAKAKLVDVQLFAHENELVLTIEDDGVGFEQERAAQGLGTKNMRMRTQKLNGEFSISSAPGEGTSIMVNIPIG